ncbi:MAG: hypothetical protein HQM14_12170 [SAR324 cluster bacterium]|nr:hypothetical protein [SAR324 cluster bacterium]
MQTASTTSTSLLYDGQVPQSFNRVFRSIQNEDWLIDKIITREYVQKAMEQFLEQGGKITVLPPQEEKVMSYTVECDTPWIEFGLGSEELESYDGFCIN